MAYSLSRYIKRGIKTTTTDSNNEKSTRTVNGLNFSDTPDSGKGLDIPSAPIFFNRLWAVSTNTIVEYALVKEQAYVGGES